MLTADWPSYVPVNCADSISTQFQSYICYKCLLYMLAMRIHISVKKSLCYLPCLLELIEIYLLPWWIFITLMMNIQWLISGCEVDENVRVSHWVDVCWNVFEGEAHCWVVTRCTGAFITIRWRAGDSGRFIHISRWSYVTSWTFRCTVLHDVSPRVSGPLSAELDVVFGFAFSPGVAQCLRWTPSSARWYPWSDAVSSASRPQCNALSWSHGGEARTRRILQWICVYMSGIAPGREARDLCHCSRARLRRWPYVRHDIVWS